MREVRKKIRETIGEAKRPVVMSSFGKDSVLLLELCRKVEPEIDVLWYRPEQRNGFAERQVLNLESAIYSYAPMSKHFIPNGEGVTVISDYSINGLPFPVLTDIEEGGLCSLKLSKERTPYFAFPWDVCLWGIKRTDTHPALEGVRLEGDFNFGGVRFIAPLWEMSDVEVWKAIKKLKVSYDEERYDRGGRDPDSIQACTRCFTSQTETVFCPDVQANIPTLAWDRQQSLAAFRARF